MNPKLKQQAVIWAVLALAFSVFGVYANLHRSFAGSSVFILVLAVIAGTVGGTLGALIGLWVRNILQPDFVITDGRVSSIAKTKLYWWIGPQLIGFFAGSLVLIAIVATKLQ